MCIDKIYSRNRQHWLCQEISLPHKTFWFVFFLRKKPLDYRIWNKKNSYSIVIEIYCMIMHNTSTLCDISDWASHLVAIDIEDRRCNRLASRLLQPSFYSAYRHCIHCFLGAHRTKFVSGSTSESVLQYQRIYESRCRPIKTACCVSVYFLLNQLC